MTDNPYAPPKAQTYSVPAGGASVSTGGDGPLYARIGPRMSAFLVDYFLMLVVFLLLALVGSQLQSSPRARAALMVLAIAFALFYEPVMVSQTGGTVGHHLKNICVVSDRTQQSPGIFAASVRSLTKMLLGSLSILWMVTSRRQQAIHDAIAGVTVRIKNPRLARRRDYVR